MASNFDKQTYTRNTRTSKPNPRARRTSPIKAGSLKFAIEKFYDDCLPLQYLREISQNSIEACNQRESGEVKWTWDRHWFERNQSYKLCCIDNGIGMTGYEVEKYINAMWESGKGIGKGANFGMGVKISAGPINKCGIEYYSWKDGVGYFATFWFDVEIDDYGMQLIKDPEGGMVDWLEDIDEKFMPKSIRENGGNGVKVVLLGNNEHENTFFGPDDVPMPSRWVQYNLNNRYFEIPKKTSLKSVRIENGKPSKSLDQIIGIWPSLRKVSEDFGTMDISDGRIHWMLLKDPESRHKFSNFDSNSQSGVLFQKEVYHKSNKLKHRGRVAANFGLTFGWNRVAIFVEPEIEGLDTDQVRKRLVMPNKEESLPWARWGYEFRENMPEPIRILEAELNQKAQRGNDLEIQNRVEEFRKKNQLPSFLQHKQGDYESDFADDNSYNSGTQGGDEPDVQDKSGYGLPESDYSYYLKEKSKRKAKQEKRKAPPITINWISEENGTRDPEYLTDMAADWLPETRQLLINEDARMWKTPFSQVLNATSDGDPIRDSLIESRCQLEYGWDLALTILNAYQINDNINWNRPKIEDQMLSAESLTGAALSHQYLVSYLTSNMGRWLSKRREEDWAI